MANQYISEFRQKLIKQYSPRRPLIISEWIVENTQLRGKPFSFGDGYEFQRQIADDTHPSLKVKKISQVGLTELQLRKSLALVCYYKGTF